jgi:hypothetical protein
MQSRGIQRLAFDIPRITLADLAQVLGESELTVKEYQSERTEMAPAQKHRLAEYLREHAATLIRLASELDTTA